VERKQILIDEVGPRDGFQNVTRFIPTEEKIEMVEMMLDAGVRMMNLTSFVSPKAVPQMADAAAVAQAVIPNHPEVSFNALIPNLRGAELAVNAGFKEVVNVISVSETHNRRNINRSHEQSFAAMADIMKAFRNVKVIAGLATAFGCPFEGETPVEKTLAVAKHLYKMGVRSFQLSDTIGVAYPTQVAAMVDAVRAELPGVEVGIHIHDTRNMGVINTWIALEHGVDYIDASVGGLGGCPFAPGASGNTSTEDLVYMFNRCGMDTGIDFGKIMAAARRTKELVEGNFSGHQLMVSSACR